MLRHATNILYQLKKMAATLVTFHTPDEEINYNTGVITDSGSSQTIKAVVMPRESLRYKPRQAISEYERFTHWVIIDDKDFLDAFDLDSTKRCTINDNDYQILEHVFEEISGIHYIKVISGNAN